MTGAQIVVMSAEKIGPMVKEEVVVEHSLEEDVGVAVAAVVLPLGGYHLPDLQKRGSPRKGLLATL
jgi:hypothetical protein